MYSRKSVGPRMDPWGTPALTGYFCEDFPSRTTQSRLLLRKEKIRLNIWPEIPLRLKFVKKISMWNPVRSLGYIKCCGSCSPRPVRSPCNSTWYNFWKTCSYQDVKPYWKSGKRPNFFRGSTVVLFHQHYYHHQINRVVDFSQRPFPNMLK